ncbi:MAG: DUF615 domain-containing protein [Desulfovibrio sp.]|nr:DUF615 domain-containing protein [Desulfovibrio sp.]
MPRKQRYQWQQEYSADMPAHAAQEAASEERPSRSAKKRACLALQALGEGLTLLSAEERRGLNLPHELEEALNLFARIKDREGRRRQLQYIGRLMRSTDPAPIRAALDGVRGHGH